MARSRRGKRSGLVATVAKPLRSVLCAVGLFSFCSNLLSLVVPLFLLQVYDRVLPSRSVDTLLLLLLIAACAVITSVALEGLRSALLSRMGAWAEVRFGGGVLAGLVEQARQGGKHSVQGLRDLSTIRHFLAGGQAVPLLDAPWTPVFIAVLFVLHPLIGTITLVGALVLVGLALLNNFLSRAPSRVASDAETDSLELAAAMTRNAEAVGAMGMRDNIVRRWQTTNAASLELAAASQERSRWLQSAARLIRLMLQLAVICAAAWLILQGEITGGGLLASVLLMRRAIAPMERAISAWPAVMRARRAVSRVSEHVARADEPAPSLPAPCGALVVKDVRYYHAGATTPVLRKVSFKVNPGEAVALVGPAGSGKSTLARLLVGNARPYRGHVLLDGHEVTSWAPEELGPHLGYLPQSVALFDGTVAENIARMGDVDAPSVFAAMQFSGITEMVRALPESADTRIGADGVRLSGGQRQRVGLARALFGLPHLVVLDEPDAHLDRDGRKALDEAIAVLKSHNAIVVLITHQVRPGGAIDRIVELRDGMVDKPAPPRRSQSLPKLSKV